MGEREYAAAEPQKKDCAAAELQKRIVLRQSRRKGLYCGRAAEREYAEPQKGNTLRQSRRKGNMLRLTKLLMMTPGHGVPVWVRDAGDVLVMQPVHKLAHEIGP